MRALSYIVEKQRLRLHYPSSRRQRHPESSGDKDERQGSDGVRQKAEREDCSADLGFEGTPLPTTHPSLPPAIPTIFHRCCLLLPLARSTTRRKGIIYLFLLTPHPHRPCCQTFPLLPSSARLQSPHFSAFPPASSFHSLAQLLDAGELSTRSCSCLIILILVHSAAAFHCSPPHSLHVYAPSAAINFVYPIIM